MIFQLSIASNLKGIVNEKQLIKVKTYLNT
jgi:hypothetical protein